MYNDAYVEQMSRTGIIVVMHTHKLFEKNDYVGGDTRRDQPVLAENNEEEPNDINKNPGLFCNATHFLDPKN